jgi:hypothetical protein
MRERLGPAAVLGEIAFEGRLAHLRGARAPLSGLSGATLAIEQATVELGAGAALGPLPLAARLVTIRGELRLGAISVPIALDALEDDGASWVRAVVRAGALDALLVVGPSRWTLTSGTLAAEGSVAPPSFVGLRATKVPLGWLPGMPADLVVTGTVKPLAADALAIGLAVELALATARSTLSALGELRSGALQDARLVGRLDAADLMAALKAAGRAPGVTLDALVDVDANVEGTLADPRVRGRVSTRAATARRDPTLRDSARVLHVDEASAVFDVSRRRLRVTEAIARARGGTIAAGASLSFGAPTADVAATPLVTVRVDGAKAPLLAEVGAVLGATIPLANGEHPGLPDDLVLSGELVVGRDLAVTGSLGFETPRSALMLHLHAKSEGDGGGSLGGASVLGSTLRGRFTAGDATAVGLFPRAWSPRATELLRVDARLTGTLARPGITGRVTAARLVMEAGEDAPRVTLGDVFALLDLGPAGLAWQRVSGRLLGGTFTSSGRLGRATGALDATLAWEGLRVEELPVPRADLAAILRGACAGDVRVERAGRTSALSARGELTILEPEYLFAKALAPRLDRYGLPPIPTRGRGPLRATLRLAGGELTVDPIAAGVRGVDVEGAVRLWGGGAVGGRILVRLAEEYLARSPLLSIPAATGSGSVVVPVYVRGTRAAPDVTTDAIEILDGLLARSRAGAAVKQALDGLRDKRRR